MPEAYCVKCKAKREMKDAAQTTMKNGTPATKGTCSTCGTNLFKIGSRNASEDTKKNKKTASPA